jgi:type I restriction enzyme M protein
MIEKGMVDCIVQMPDKLFLTTGIPACLFLLSKNRDGKDGVHRKRNKEILFIDARKLGHLVNKRLRVFNEADVQKIANAYHQWRNIGENHADVEGFCKTSSFEEVAAKNYVLSPGRYVGTEAEEDDGVSFEKKMNKLTSELSEEFEDSERLKLQIKSNLKLLGFKIS